jgi:RNA polymerase sigma factor (sigma-70 family)
MFAKKTDFWAKAYQQNAPKLLALCRRYVSDASKAEDLMHDAFVTAIHKQAHFQGKGHFEGWLAKITLNTVLMYLRQDKQFHKMLHQMPMADSIEVLLDSELECISNRQIIQSVDFESNMLLEIINLLPEHHKTVFNLYVLEHFSHQQIAEALGISVGTSKSHLARARKKIQHLLVQKAIEMKQNRRKIIYLPVLGKKEDYLNELFQKKLSNHVIQPKSLPPHLKNLFEKMPAPKPYWAQLSLWVSILGVTLFAWKSLNAPAPTLKTLTSIAAKENNLETNSYQNKIQIIDNQKITLVKPILKPTISILKPIAVSVDSPITVIVKKQIILRDTIYQLDEND